MSPRCWNRVLLTVVFYLVRSPTAIIMRLIVENLLDLKTGEQESYWRDRPAGEYDPVQTEKMY
jgi:hypothetical protein